MSVIIYNLASTTACPYHLEDPEFCGGARRPSPWPWIRSDGPLSRIDPRGSMMVLLDPCRLVAAVDGFGETVPAPPSPRCRIIAYLPPEARGNPDETLQSSAELLGASCPSRPNSRCAGGLPGGGDRGVFVDEVFVDSGLGLQDTTADHLSPGSSWC